MQLMPSVAENYGIDSNSTVDQHIAAAVKHLKNFQKTLSDSLKEPDKTMFLIASYNAGAGYINMARASAKEKGINANLWFGNVEEFLIEREQWAKHNLNRKNKGNNKAFQAVDYVESILDIYYHYKNLTDYWKEELKDN
jgi:membrane-bound lytic murein transglycosylase F